MDTITKALNEIMNAKKAGKDTYTVKRASKLLVSVFDIMKKHKYIDYKIEKGKFDKIIVEIKKLNECRSIRPRFYVEMREIEKYVRRFLPSRDLGIIIISTDKGLLTNQETEEKRTGGCLIAYCF